MKKLKTIYSCLLLAISLTSCSYTTYVAKERYIEEANKIQPLEQPYTKAKSVSKYNNVLQYSDGTRYRIPNWSSVERSERDLNNEWKVLSCSFGFDNEPFFSLAGMTVQDTFDVDIIKEKGIFDDFKEYLTIDYYVNYYIRPFGIEAYIRSYDYASKGTMIRNFLIRFNEYGYVVKTEMRTRKEYPKGYDRSNLFITTTYE